MSAFSPRDDRRIEVAARRISAVYLRRRWAMSGSLSELCGVPVGLKLEHHRRPEASSCAARPMRCFRFLPATVRSAVIAASTGNHGRALAHAAKAEGSLATICMSHLVP